MKNLTLNELQQISGGDKYYGNGVHCNDKECHVDWEQAKGAIGQIVVNGWVQHGPWAH